MKKQNGFERLGLILLSGLIAGACSPLAPSVSKLSNASSQKTTPTDGSSPTTSLLSGNLTSAKGIGSLSVQVTQASPYSQFKKDWALVRDVKPSMELDDDATLDELSAAGVIKFFSNADKVKGSEDALSATPTKIFLAVNADAAGIASLGLDNVKLNLAWKPASISNPAPHWELSLAAPNTGDAVKDLNEANQMKSALHDRLLDIGIEFQAE
ncbi:MAG: hypothetical protein HY074_13890 [Deltaproteobacteria bacterium]|nr:hypothetical protein [Deltaproteobacteria bacterium]